MGGVGRTGEDMASVPLVPDEDLGMQTGADLARPHALGAEVSVDLTLRMRAEHLHAGVLHSSRAYEGVGLLARHQNRRRARRDPR
ncbi:hypothetical protein [Ornithinimicrobium kibberense]|uniref:hypothetical protein n=1 Tax=Ornithinimicrobium kibberense TaxID=282060 RepID=UPI0036123418